MTDEELIAAYTIEKKSAGKIGREYGVAGGTISNRLSRLGVQMRGRYDHLGHRKGAAEQYYERPWTLENRDEEFVSLILAHGGYQNAYVAGLRR